MSLRNIMLLLCGASFMLATTMTKADAGLFCRKAGKQDFEKCVQRVKAERPNKSFIFDRWGNLITAPQSGKTKR
jgi:hypothetical protein